MPPKDQLQRLYDRLDELANQVSALNTQMAVIQERLMHLKRYYILAAAIAGVAAGVGAKAMPWLAGS